MEPEESKYEHFQLPWLPRSPLHHPRKTLVSFGVLWPCRYLFPPPSPPLPTLTLALPPPSSFLLCTSLTICSLLWT